MRCHVWKVLLLLPLLVALFYDQPALAAPADKVEAGQRCPVCGMFVAKYDNWITQARDLKANKTWFFDGVKDLLVFWFDPQAYGGPGRDALGELWVKDYYTLKWIAAREGVYVIGSEGYGPMGHEFIPFAGRKAAESFLHDHKGTAIVTFAEITPAMVASMREGQRMR